MGSITSSSISPGLAEERGGRTNNSSSNHISYRKGKKNQGEGLAGEKKEGSRLFYSCLLADRDKKLHVEKAKTPKR